MQICIDCTAMIKTTALTFQYRKSQPLQFPDMELSKDAVILGPSGVGKTTLLHLIGGLLTPTSGQVFINGTNTSILSRFQMDHFRKKHIGIIFQQHHSLRALTVFENLLTINRMGSKNTNTDQLNLLLSELDLQTVKHKKPNQLSQGQKQRLSIALALVNEPTLLLADEPTSSLDDINCERAIELLKNEAIKHQSQLIVITHDQRVIPHFNQKIAL